MWSPLTPRLMVAAAALIAGALAAVLPPRPVGAAAEEVFLVQLRAASSVGALSSTRQQAVASAEAELGRPGGVSMQKLLDKVIQRRNSLLEWLTAANKRVAELYQGEHQIKQGL